MALRQGRFTFRHDSVLTVLVVALESFLSSKKCINAQSNNCTKSVKAGAKLPKCTKKLHSGLLHLTAARKLLSDPFCRGTSLYLEFYDFLSSFSW